MRNISAALAILVFWSPIAGAQTGLDPVIKTLRDNGYRSIEVEREGNRIKVEARRGGQERELVYDARTGRLVSDDTRAQSGGISLGSIFGGDRTGARVRDNDNDDDDDDRSGRSGGASGGGDRDDDDDDDRSGRSGGGDRDDDDDDGSSRSGNGGGGGSGGGGGRDDNDDDDNRSSSGGRGGGNDSDDDDD